MHLQGARSSPRPPRLLPTKLSDVGRTRDSVQLSDLTNEDSSRGLLAAAAMVVGGGVGGLGTSRARVAMLMACLEVKLAAVSCQPLRACGVHTLRFGDLQVHAGCVTVLWLVSVLRQAECIERVVCVPVRYKWLAIALCGKAAAPY